MSECLMTNCRNKAPTDEAMCARHRRPFTFATPVKSEGARVGLVSCEICGAALLLDDRDSENYMALHLQWHCDSLG